MSVFHFINITGNEDRSPGARSGKLRKNPVMRVIDGSAYAVVASKSGSDEHRASKSRRHRH